MSMILLAVEDSDRDAPLRDLLTAEGWWVTTVHSREEAVRAAADHAPQLLIIDRELAQPEGLLGGFARDGGGCRVLVLIDSRAEAAASEDLGDGLLARDDATPKTLAKVRESLESPREGPAQAASAAAADEQLTALDLFGDILEDLGEGDAPGTSADAAQVDATQEAEEPEGDEAVHTAVDPEPAPVAVDALADSEADADLRAEEATEADLKGAQAPEVSAVEVDLDEPDPAPPSDSRLEDVAVEAPIEEPELIEEPEPIEEPESIEEPDDVLELEILPDEGQAAAEVAGFEPEDLDPPVEPVDEEAATEQLPDEELAAAVAAIGGTADEPTTDDPLEVEPIYIDESGHASGTAAPSTGVQQLAPPLSELEADDGEPTTDLIEEVADLLESGRAAWRVAGDEPDSGEGLSIEEVLAAAAPEPESEPETEPEPEPVDEEVSEGEVSESAAASDSPTVGDRDLEQVGGFYLVELMEFSDLTERWLASRVDGSGRDVVLERVRHELRNRSDVRDAFVEGYSEAAGWDHECVLEVVDLGRDGDVDYVATTYRPGRSLSEVLDRVQRMEARMPLGVSLLLVERIASALEVLGGGPAGSRHGWLVPGSIWLTEDGAVLLREFGFGRLQLSETTVARDWTEHRFTAPERRAERGDIRSDLYSLGALLYEMVSGQPIHRARDFDGLLDAIREEHIMPLQQVDPTIPSEIDGWVMRLLRRNPAERPQSVSDVVAKIDLALQALPARPANAELNAYVRQLFAARLPEPKAPEVDLPIAPDPLEAPLPADDEIESGSGGRRWDWWWLLIPLLALLSAFVGWRLLGSAGSAALWQGTESVREARWPILEPEEPAATPTVSVRRSFH